MTYLSGQIISANNDPDFNTLVNDLNEIVSDNHAGNTIEGVADFGYGQAIDPALATVAPGENITAVQWTAFFDRMTDCAYHQAIPIGDVPTSVASGDVITAFDGINGVITILGNLQTNRFKIGNGNATITAGGTKDQSVRSTAWSSDIVHEFTVTFSSYNAARHYFNCGGGLLLSGSRTGGTVNATNTNWTQMLTDIGTVTMGHTSVTADAGQLTNIGFYNLTDSYQTIFTKGVTGYAGDQYLLEAKVDGGPLGSSGIIRFRITCSTSGTADGTLTSNIDEQRSTGTFPQTSPVYATTIELST